MTAGRGIVHSERTPAALRAAPSRLHGLQLWVALPRADEETTPDFHHHAAEALPVVREGGVELRVLAGEAFGARAPVRTSSPLFLLDVSLPDGPSCRSRPGRPTEPPTSSPVGSGPVAR